MFYSVGFFDLGSKKVTLSNSICPCTAVFPYNTVCSVYPREAGKFCPFYLWVCFCGAFVVVVVCLFFGEYAYNKISLAC